MLLHKSLHIFEQSPSFSLLPPLPPPSSYLISQSTSFLFLRLRQRKQANHQEVFQQWSRSLQFLDNWQLLNDCQMSSPLVPWVTREYLALSLQIDSVTQGPKAQSTDGCVTVTVSMTSTKYVLSIGSCRRFNLCLWLQVMEVNEWDKDKTSWSTKRGKNVVSKAVTAVLISVFDYR